MTLHSNTKVSFEVDQVKGYVTQVGHELKILFMSEDMKIVDRYSCLPSRPNLPPFGIRWMN